jgi:hypothetical protein
MSVRSRLVGSVVALGLLACVPVAANASPAKPAAITTCKRAIIGGQSKCIARGQFCAKGHARDYVRYGLSCTNRDVNGRYHLR